jgi:type II secretory pathway pseudopilin PulG
MVSSGARATVTGCVGGRITRLPFASLRRTDRGCPPAFTFVELLVVIAVLAAILFTVLAQARIAPVVSSRERKRRFRLHET